MAEQKNFEHIQVPDLLPWQDKRVMPADVTLVIFHGPAGGCPDGFAAAASAYLRLGPNVRFLMLDYNTGPKLNVQRDVRPEDHVAILDFSLPEETTAALLHHVSGNVIILDHHSTAKENFAGLPNEFAVFDMSRSGAVLAWNFFFPYKAVPRFLAYIEARDTWQSKSPNFEAWNIAREAHLDMPLAQGFLETDDELQQWAAAIHWTDEHLQKLIEGAAQMVVYRNSLMRGLVKNAAVRYLRVMPEVPVVLLNSCMLQSDLGHFLLNHRKFENAASFALIVNYKPAEQLWAMAFRGGSKHELDLAKIAKQHFGGGGHKSAAGGCYKGSNIEDILVPL